MQMRREHISKMYRIQTNHTLISIYLSIYLPIYDSIYRNLYTLYIHIIAYSMSNHNTMYFINPKDELLLFHCPGKDFRRGGQ